MIDDTTTSLVTKLADITQSIQSGSPTTEIGRAHV